MTGTALPTAAARPRPSRQPPRLGLHRQRPSRQVPPRRRLPQRSRPRTGAQTGHRARRRLRSRMPSRTHRLRQLKPRPSRSGLPPTSPHRGPARSRARRVRPPVHRGQLARPGRPLACRARPGQVPGRAITRSVRRRPAWGRRREVPGRVRPVHRPAGVRRPLPASQAPAKAPGRVARPVRAHRACPDARVRLRGRAGRGLVDLVPAPAVCRPGR
jgi:hypothetical protein